MNNPLRHVGQTARPEEKTPPSPDDQAGDAGAEARQQNPGEEDSGTLEQHPRTTPDAATGPPAGPRSGQKEIKDLKPGEPPPESSAGS